jgi:hypothetical protein
VTVVGTFYTAWFLVFLNAFIYAAGGSVPVEVSRCDGDDDDDDDDDDDSGEEEEEEEEENGG